MTSLPQAVIVISLPAGRNCDITPSGCDCDAAPPSGCDCDAAPPGCNCDPAGVTSSFAGCGSLEHLGELCECKPHVTGRICDTCRPLFWNLQINNPDGCEGKLNTGIQGLNNGGRAASIQ